jgi:hypothetical protein
MGVVTQSRSCRENGMKDEEGLGFGDPPAEMLPHRKGRGGGRKLDRFREVPGPVCVTRDGPGSRVTDGLTSRGNEAHLIGRK